MEYRWDWKDPILHFNWMKCNYWDVENELYEEFIEDLNDSDRFDTYCTYNRKNQEDQFGKWLLNNYYKIVSAFSSL